MTRPRLVFEFRWLGASLGCCASALALAGCLLPGWDSDDIIAERTCQDVQRWYVTSEYAPAWSPLGDRVVASVSRAPSGELSPGFYLVDLRTHAWKKLAPGTWWKRARQSTWNPRDDRVLLSYDPGADVLEVETGTLRTLTDADGQRIYNARWSPEGDSIWYGRTGGMHVMAAAGGLPRLFHPLGATFRPIGGWAFSPDGRTLAYAHAIQEDNGTYRFRNEIRIIGRDGRGVRQLTHLAGNAMNPLWIHGGREILFDWTDSLCFNSVADPQRTTLAVDIYSGRIRRLGEHLGSLEYQFSFPIAVDPQGERAAVVGGNLDKVRGKHGVLYLTPIERPHLHRLFRPGSPELP